MQSQIYFYPIIPSPLSRDLVYGLTTVDFQAQIIRFLDVEAFFGYNAGDLEHYKRISSLK
jgi:hypothetical protein